jgi:hypothetical protein
MSDRPHYTLRLRPDPSDVPPVLRLRRGLKYLKRACSLTCEAVEETECDRGCGPWAAATPGGAGLSGDGSPPGALTGEVPPAARGGEAARR